jgi:tRNA nucleotidyltransferase (CCA-adding enzyme)
VSSDLAPTCVHDLMSRGVKTVAADAELRDIIRELRLIGHEGYPVVENGQIVGLLNRRDADKAIEHGLDSLRVRDVMQSGSVLLASDATIANLEQIMLSSGWGQIPIVDENGTLIGIVTRTDLIKYWARVHGHTPDETPHVSRAQITQTLGENIATLIDAIAQVAQAQGLGMYLVGGCVRDLLLQRRNLDIDFVVEGDAIGFAERLQKQFSGALNTFKPFGTAKWSPDDDTSKRLGITGLPDHIDFASARNEFYQQPTALPTVYQSSIKLDLQRRDFTINTLAIAASPSFGQLLDFFGGARDLELAQIRVLHSLSFIDDPTRIIRAVRFVQRLKFHIEARTEALIVPALPMLRRITGERIRNELDLLLQEPTPEAGWLRLQGYGVLSAIHPALRFDERMAATFASARDHAENDATITLTDLYWHVWATYFLSADVHAICERLLFPRSLQESMAQTAQLQTELDKLANDSIKPSDIFALLQSYPPIALQASIITTDNALVRAHLRDYLTTFQHVRIMTTGDDLKALGLKPSPCFKRILDRLRLARLDGEVEDDAGEKRLLQQLIDGGICNDDL